LTWLTGRLTGFPFACSRSPRISQRAILTRLENDEFVLDQEQNTIIGLVSTSYVSYGNDAFLADIEGLLGICPGMMGINFRRGMASTPS
jgi:hypothetical protein